MSEWTIFIDENCIWCKKTLKLFEDRHMIIKKEIFSGKIDELETLNNKRGSKEEILVYIINPTQKKEFFEQNKNILFKTFPVIFEGKNLFGGYTHLIESFYNPW